MYTRPKFVLKANGKETSKLLMDRVLAVSVMQKTGFSSDTCTIVLDDHLKNRVQLPSEEDVISIAIGYSKNQDDEKDLLIDYGQFDVGEFALTGNNDVFTIYGNKSTWSKGGQVASHYSWPSTIKDPLLLEDLLTTIANKYGFELCLSPLLSQIKLPAIEQSESDLQLLTRLASYYDAITKIIENKLIFIPRGTGKTLSGLPLAEVNLVKEQLINWSLLSSKYLGYKSCNAYYYDFINASRNKVSVGGGEPSLDLHYSYADMETAKWAAQTRLNYNQRLSKSINLTCIGEPNIMAGGVINLNGVRTHIDGKWFVSQVEHCIDESGYITKVNCEKLI